MRLVGRPPHSLAHRRRAHAWSCRRDELSGAAAEAEARAAAAEQQRAAAEAALAELQAGTAAQASALKSKYEPQLDELRQAAAAAAQGAEAAKRCVGGRGPVGWAAGCGLWQQVQRTALLHEGGPTTPAQPCLCPPAPCPRALQICRQYEQLKLRYESLELRAQQAAQQLAAATARAGEADALSARLEALQAEHATLRSELSAASGSRAGEVASLRATNASLKDELADLRSVNEVLREQLSRQPPPGSAAGGSASGAALAGGSQASLLLAQLSGVPASLGGELERAGSGGSLASSAAGLGSARQRTLSDAGAALLSPMDSLMSPLGDAGASGCACCPCHVTAGAHGCVPLLVRCQATYLTDTCACPAPSLPVPARTAASAQLSALAEKERELGAARQRAAGLEAELADLERECALRQAQEEVRAWLLLCWYQGAEGWAAVRMRAVPGAGGGVWSCMLC